MKELNEKLLKIQELLKAPKSQRNEFGKYNYRSCEDIFEAVKPILKEQGLTLRLNDELMLIGDRYYIKATAILSDGNEVITNTAYAREEETKKGMDGSQITGASSSYARKYALNGLFLIDDVKDSDSTNLGEITTKEEAEKYVLTFGKYKDKTLKEVLETDKKYIDWLFYSEKTDPTIKSCITLMTGLVIPSEEEQNEILLLIDKINKLVQEKNVDYEKMLKHYKVKSNQEMSLEQLRDCVKKLEEK